jgi:inositol transporter-like SP family MFS transporter
LSVVSGTVTVPRLARVSDGRLDEEKQMSRSIAVPRRRPWKTATLAGMASYLDAAALVTSGVAIGGSYAEPLGLDAATIGFLLGLQTLMFALGALFGGRIGDRFGRRRVFTSSLLLYAVGVTLLLIVAAPWMLYVGVVAVGLAIGADLAVSLALINEEAPPGRRGRWSSSPTCSGSPASSPS